MVVHLAIDLLPFHCLHHNIFFQVKQIHVLEYNLDSPCKQQVSRRKKEEKILSSLSVNKDCLFTELNLARPIIAIHE